MFPLLETAAVDHLRIKIGERIIEGRIKERAEAKQLYDQAKRGRETGPAWSNRNVRISLPLQSRNIGGPVNM